MPHLLLLHFVHLFFMTTWFLFSFSRIKRKAKKERGNQEEGWGERNEWGNNEKKREKEKPWKWKKRMEKARGKEKKKGRQQVVERGRREREKRGKQRVSQKVRVSAHSLSLVYRQLLGAPPQLLSNTELAAQPLITIPRKWNVGFTSENFHLLFHQVKWNTEFKAQANDLCFLWDT